VAFRQQAVAHVRADKTRRSGYDHSQETLSPVKVIVAKPLARSPADASLSKAGLIKQQCDHRSRKC
jgi:hypothetical protein